jgi:plasmid stability protein
MASVTIRNLEDSLKTRLRVRAASRGRSMEEEARQILRLALQESPRSSTNLAESIRRRFARLGDVQLPSVARESVRDFALPADVAGGGPKSSSKTRPRKKQPRS